MYSYKTRVGFSQADVEQYMTITSVIDTFQDSSCFHSDDLGVGFYYLHPNNLVWIINYWELEFINYPKYSDVIEVGTSPYEFKGFMGFRNFVLKDEQGEYLVKANSLWVLMDWDKMLPAKVPQILKDAYVLEEKIDMTYSKRKIDIPGDIEGSIRNDVVVQKHHLDANDHVNNGQYIKIAMEQIDEKRRCSRLRVEYCSQAHLGDVIYPVVYVQENVNTVVLNSADNKPYAIIELQY